MEELNAIKSRLSGFDWSTSKTSIKDVLEKKMLPLIVKPSKELCEGHSISRNDFILLHHHWQTHRVVCQAVEDGTYMVGPQIELPITYMGTFCLKTKLMRDEEPSREFLSVSQIAAALPERVFPETQMTVPVPTEVAIGSNNRPEDSNLAQIVVLRAGEPLIVGRCEDVNAVVPTKFGHLEQMFGQKRPMVKTIAVRCLNLTSQTTKITHKIPLSHFGKFSTRFPQLKNNQILDVRNIVMDLDIPSTITPTDNRPDNHLNKYRLFGNQPLRVVAIEEHDMVVSVTTECTFKELSTEHAEFHLPTVIENGDMSSGNSDDLIEYKQTLQDFILQCEIKDSDINVSSYCKSITIYTSRSQRLTSPQPLHTMAAERTFKYSPKAKEVHGKSAIYFLSTANAEGASNGGRILTSSSSRPPPMRTRVLPQPPAVSDNETDGDIGPPLPPRNSKRNSLISLDSDDGTGQSASLKRQVAPPPPDFPAPLVGDEQNELSNNELEEDVWGTIGMIPIIQRSTNARGRVTHEDVVITTTQNHDVTDVYAMGEDDEDAGCRSPQFMRNDMFDPSPLPKRRNAINTQVPSANLMQLSTSSDSDSDSSSARSIQIGEVDCELNNMHDDERIIQSENATDVSDHPSATSQNPVETLVDTSGGVEAVYVNLTPTANGPMLSPLLSRRSLASDEMFTSERCIMPSPVITPQNMQHVYIAAASDWQPPNDLYNMTVSEVADSLRFIGMPENIARCFFNEKIDGELLHNLSDDMLQGDFNLGKFYRMKLSKFIAGWRPRTSVVNYR